MFGFDFHFHPFSSTIFCTHLFILLPFIFLLVSSNHSLIIFYSSLYFSLPFLLFLSSSFLDLIFRLLHIIPLPVHTDISSPRAHHCTSVTIFTLLPFHYPYISYFTISYSFYSYIPPLRNATF